VDLESLKSTLEAGRLKAALLKAQVGGEGADQQSDDDMTYAMSKPARSRLTLSPVCWLFSSPHPVLVSTYI
jgi:hypothetical protein